MEQIGAVGSTSFNQPLGGVQSPTPNRQPQEVNENEELENANTENVNQTQNNQGNNVEGVENETDNANSDVPAAGSVEEEELASGGVGSIVDVFA